MSFKQRGRQTQGYCMATTRSVPDRCFDDTSLVRVVTDDVNVGGRRGLVAQRAIAAGTEVFVDDAYEGVTYGHNATGGGGRGTLRCSCR
jgi:hypothetical protein